MSRLRNRFILLIPAYWACLFDETITILQQPAAYWNGDLNAGNEANPIGATLMRNHASGIFVISFAWLVVIGIFGYWLPERLRKTFALVILMAHTGGAISWITPHYGFWYSIIFIVFNSALFVQLDKVYSQNIENAPL
ncbi:hypothetical protein [Spirosoma foliorum]|uniref:DUF5658 domain-containing protein n=1 Tax=Spirosoma foliorum TaxID=2710596 RepID=A0A7G5GPU1_9BACT|nr:hypothetical protein [Spirosoma foliorum]QMW00883.1 hypothetical protein H3H32_23270 [Spirosoma foliorum]